MTEADLVHRDPEVLGGTPVFVGTRVPVQTLWDYLEAGDSLDGFLDHFPTVKREHAVTLLELCAAEDSGTCGCCLTNACRGRFGSILMGMMS